jgi:hypothetical protein
MSSKVDQYQMPPPRARRSRPVVETPSTTTSSAELVDEQEYGEQDILSAGLSMILDAQSDIEVVGEAADGCEAVAFARELP